MIFDNIVVLKNAISCYKWYAVNLNLVNYTVAEH